MKKYSVVWKRTEDDKFVLDMAAESDGQWVPASVAQALYDALQKVAQRLDANDCDEWTLYALKTTAFEALALADGKE